MEATGEPEEEGEKEEGPEKDEDSCRAPEAPEFLPAEDHGAEEESPAEVRGDQQAHPGSATAGLLQQHEERREQEEQEEEQEARGQPAEEPAPPAPADAKGAESVGVPSEQREAPGGQESPDTDTSGEPEHKEPAVGGEIQVMAGSVEAAEEIPPPVEPELGNSPPSEGPSQEPGAPDMKQEDAE